MASKHKSEEILFDEWPDRYDDWFRTPIGRLVKKYETDLLLEMLLPQNNENILDVGCGTGVFTKDVLANGALVTGLDLSLPMLKQASHKLQGNSFDGLVGDMMSLPFADESFDKVFSMTAIEFVADAKHAISELNRVTKKNGTIVLTTLNSLSPWAERRTEAGKSGHKLFQNMVFRSPDEMKRIVSHDVTVKTAIHFLKNDNPGDVVKIEREGAITGNDTGAFLALAWKKS